MGIKLGDEKQVLAEIPPLSQILGLTEGQLVIYGTGSNYSSDADKYVISELYDNYLRLTRRNGSGYTYRDIDMKKVESLMQEGWFTPLTKNNKPAMGRREGLFKRVWRVE